MNDLLNNSDAPRSSRRNGTTSSGAVGVPSYTERTYESRLRRQQLQTIENPPEDENARRWRLHEETWAAREKKWAEDEKRKQDAIRAEEKAQKEASRREAERQQRQRDYRLKEQLLDGIFEDNALSANEQAQVHQRLVDAGRPLDLEMAVVISRQIALERQGEPVPKSSGFQVDWRGTLTAKKK